MNPEQAKVIALMGPTASGKTALAMAIFDKLEVELISVDSLLVYRQMNIGTAKPSPEELKNYPHHLIDIRDPIQPYSAADFKNDATALIDEIHSRGKIPLLVGGTMLYFKALLQGINELPSANEEIREKLLQLANQKGWQYLHQQLEQIDPVAAKRIHSNDPQRIQRALEVYEVSGKSLTDWQQSTPKNEHNWKVISIAIAPKERQVLRQRIALRFEDMLEQGLEQEVAQLIARSDLKHDLPALRAVGYRQMWQYLHGEIDFEEMKFRAITATRQLAKRQMTWLRSWPDLQWLYPEDENLIEKAINLIE